MSASRSEIEPFFPSITHECIRVGMGILSKLRSSTGPGKGNDLKPEEYAALPGVSAFLAAERLHSSDLPERSAQKASSVSMPHFRSCLAKARHILSSASQPSTPTRRPQRAAAMANPFAAGPSRLSNEEQMAELTAKLVTPPSGKRPRPSPSRRDLTGLIDRTPTKTATPARPSPLKQSTTPSKPKSTIRRSAWDVRQDGEDEEQDEMADVHATPSKRSRVAIPTPGRLTASVKGKRRGTVDTTAFFAARPDTPTEAKERARRDLESEERGLEREMDERRRAAEAKRAALGGARESTRGERQVRRNRRDWTYHEAPWARHTGPAQGGKCLENLIDEITNWCATNGYPLPSVTSKTPANLKELYLSFNVDVESTAEEHCEINASEPTVASEAAEASSMGVEL